MLCGAAESSAGAVLSRAGERAVQDGSSGEVKRLAVVAQAAGDLTVVDEPWSWSERVAVVTEPCQDLPGVREARFEPLQRVDGSVERPSNPVASCCAVHGSLTLASSASTARSSAVRCTSRS
jgi:hypothetical protein